MKKSFLLLIISISLSGCLAIDYSELSSPFSPTDNQLERIIALDLSYAESINEANKIIDKAIALSVVKELERRKLNEDIAILELENVDEIANKVVISDNNLIFSGPVINERKKVGLLLDSDYQDYFLKGFKNQNTGFIDSKLQLTITYEDNKLRNYSYASLCDKWQGCEGDNQMDINIISSNAFNCSTSNCNYREVMVLNLTDDFLKNNMDDGVDISFHSNKNKNKISLSSIYIKGFLKAAK